MVSDPEEASTSLPFAAVLVLTSVGLMSSSFLSRVLRGSIPSTFRLTARVFAGLRLEAIHYCSLPKVSLLGGWLGLPRWASHPLDYMVLPGRFQA